MSDPVDPFREYHRARRRMTLTRSISLAVVSAALAVGLTALAGAAPQAPAAAPVSTPDATSAIPSPTATEAPVALPEPLPTQPATPDPEPLPAELPATGPTSWSITVDTVGYQAEIDQCLWVRMNIGASAPIVGAHNYCGGGDVLEMQLGDSVILAGTGLDGVYVVTDSRDARAGDIAATATAGLVATVILQSCYWRNDGSERLVALTRVG